MAGKRRRFTAEFKARVALEALRERQRAGDRHAARASSEPGDHMEAAAARRAARRCLPGARAARPPWSTRRGSGTCTRRSGSSRSSGIFFGAGSSAEPGGAGADDRAGRTAESLDAVCAAGGEPVLAVLPAAGRARRTWRSCGAWTSCTWRIRSTGAGSWCGIRAARASPRAGTGSDGSCA